MLFSHANILERTFTNYTNPLAPYQRGFEPRPEILRENHTLTLIAVGLNNNDYSNPVRDPLFRPFGQSPLMLLVRMGRNSVWRDTKLNYMPEHLAVKSRSVLLNEPSF
jgi:hypothetical protein